MNRVREIRKALGITQGELAKAARVTGAALSFIETGRTKRVKPKNMAAIAEALGCAVRDAFPEADPQDPGPAEAVEDVHGTCRWCGRRYIKAQAAVLSLAGKKIYEAGNLRCLAEYIAENTDRQGNWKKHRNTGLR